jgi:hypothetical protein
MEGSVSPSAFGEGSMAGMFTTNEGVADRAVRVVAGLVVLSLVFVGPKSLWGLVGALPLLTGLVGFCPLYTLLGISTAANKKQ